VLTNITDSVDVEVGIDEVDRDNIVLTKLRELEQNIVGRKLRELEQ
jgi:hypothetical protein